MIESGSTTPLGVTRPPTPPQPSGDYRVNVSNAVLETLRTTRKTLNYEVAIEDEVKEEDAEGEMVTDDTLPSDVSMAEVPEEMEEEETVQEEVQEEMEEVQEELEEEEENRAIVPMAPVLMAVKALSVIIGELVHDSCIGCQLDCPGQRDHEDCIWMSWADMVDKYFDNVLARLSEARFFHFVDVVYNMTVLFENEEEYCVAEATEFFHYELIQNDVQAIVKNKLKKQ